MRLLTLLLSLLFVLTACQHPAEKKEPAKAKAKPPKALIPDASTDTSFQSFLGRLRAAVAKRDHPTIASMMAPDFGWRWEQPQPGTAFQYWDETNAWPHLDRLLHERFAPNEGYMVSPPAFATDSTYRDYRCGMRQVNGSWKFAYFVTGEDILP